MSDERTFKVKTSEGIREVTEEQLVSLAGKAIDLLPKMQSERDSFKKEFDLLKAESEAAFDFINDFKAVLNKGEGSREAAERLGSVIGWDSDDIEEILGDDDVDDEPRPVRSPKNRRVQEDDDEEFEERRAIRKRKDRNEFFPEDEELTQVRSKPRKLTLEDLDPSLQQEFRSLQKKRLTDTREFMFSQMKDALAKDSELSVYFKDDKLARVIGKLGTETLRRRVGLDGEEFGPRVINEILEEVRGFVKDSGIQNPEKKKMSAAALGLGPAAESIADVLHREQPPQRVRVSGGDSYKRNMFERLAHKVAKSGGLTDADVDSPEEQEEEEMSQM